MTTPAQMLQFIGEAEKLKRVMRHCWHGDERRRESVAEHTWMMMLLAVLSFDELSIELDRLRVLKMILVHDLVEIYNGDIPAFTKDTMDTSAIHAAERDALLRLLSPLDAPMRDELVELWDEFEANTTPAANFANALDKAEALTQHNLVHIDTWTQGDFDIQPYYRDQFFNFDPFMRALKDEIDRTSMRKIEAANALDRVKPEFVTRWRDTGLRADDVTP